MKQDTLFSVADQVVLLSGASRGIGQALAKGFAERDAQVIITDREAKTIEQTARQYHQHRFAQHLRAAQGRHALRDEQGRSRHDDPRHGDGMGRARRARERHRAGIFSDGADQENVGHCEVIEGGTLEVTRESGVTQATLEPGKVYYRKAGDTHAAKNISSTRYHEVLVELK